MCMHVYICMYAWLHMYVCRCIYLCEDCCLEKLFIYSCLPSKSGKADLHGELTQGLYHRVLLLALSHNRWIAIQSFVPDKSTPFSTLLINYHLYLTLPAVCCIVVLLVLCYFVVLLPAIRCYFAFMCNFICYYLIVCYVKRAVVCQNNLCLRQHPLLPSDLVKLWFHPLCYLLFTFIHLLQLSEVFARSCRVFKEEQFPCAPFVRFVSIVVAKEGSEGSHVWTRTGVKYEQTGSQHSRKQSWDVHDCWDVSRTVWW